MPWLVWFSGLSIGLWASRVWVADQVPGWEPGGLRESFNQSFSLTSMFLFLSFPLLSPLSKNRYIKCKKKNEEVKVKKKTLFKSLAWPTPNGPWHPRSVSACAFTRTRVGFKLGFWSRSSKRIWRTTESDSELFSLTINRPSNDLTTCPSKLGVT